jgi:hypothetical protein
MNNKKSFKEKWNSKDEICLTCGQVTKRNIGLTKQNVMSLFKKPTMQEWLIFLMLILVLSIAFTYQTEIQQCKSFMGNPEKFGYYYDNQRNPFSNNQIFQEEIFQLDNNENS